MRKYLVPKPVLVALVASAGLGAVLAAGPHSSRAAAPMTSLPGQRVSRLMHVPRIRLGGEIQVIRRVGRGVRQRGGRA